MVGERSRDGVGGDACAAVEATKQARENTADQGRTTLCWFKPDCLRIRPSPYTSQMNKARMFVRPLNPMTATRAEHSSIRRSSSTWVVAIVIPTISQVSSPRWRGLRVV